MKDLVMASKKKTVKRIEVQPNSLAFFSRWFRAQRGISQIGLADMISVHKSAISQLEVDKYNLPLDLMKKIYKVCDLNEKKFLMECLHHDLERLFEER